MGPGRTKFGRTPERSEAYAGIAENAQSHRTVTPTLKGTTMTRKNIAATIAAESVKSAESVDIESAESVDIESAESVDIESAESVMPWRDCVVSSYGLTSLDEIVSSDPTTIYFCQACDIRHIAPVICTRTVPLTFFRIGDFDASRTYAAIGAYSAESLVKALSIGLAAYPAPSNITKVSDIWDFRELLGNFEEMSILHPVAGTYMVSIVGVKWLECEFTMYDILARGDIKSLNGKASKAAQGTRKPRAKRANGSESDC